MLFYYVAVIYKNVYTMDTEVVRSKPSKSGHIRKNQMNAIGITLLSQSYEQIPLATYVSLSSHTAGVMALV